MHVTLVVTGYMEDNSVEAHSLSLALTSGTVCHQRSDEPKTLTHSERNSKLIFCFCILSRPTATAVSGAGEGLRTARCQAPGV